MNKGKCRCKCKKLVKCNKRFIWNPNSCECEYKERAAYLLTNDCEEIIDKNNTLLIKKYNKYLKTFDNCKPYIASSILFLLISITITGAIVYFYLNSSPKRKLQDYYTYYKW